MAVRLERPHAEFLGQGQGLAVMFLSDTPASPAGTLWFGTDVLARIGSTM